MKALILWVTEGGRLLGERLASLGLGKALRFKKDLVAKAFSERIPLIFIGAAGIAVRSIAPFLKHKSLDPPVLVLDEGANFVISLLSGHLGGANHLACEIAKKIGATPVVTTASEVKGLPALDLWLTSKGGLIEDWQTLKGLQMKLVNGKELKVFLEPPLDFEIPAPIKRAQNPAEADFVLTYRGKPYGRPAFVLKVLCVGLGFHAEEEKLPQKVASFLKENGLHLKAVKALATFERRAPHEGLELTAQELGARIILFNEKEIRKTKTFSPSYAYKVFELPGVAEPCALLAAQGGPLLIPKTVYQGVTIAVALSKERPPCGPN